MDRIDWREASTDGLSWGGTVKVATLRQGVAQASAPLPAPFVATVAFLILGSLAPLLIIGATPDDRSSGNYLGPLTVSVLAGGRYALILGSRQRRLYEMTFWLFTYVFLGVAPLVQLRLGQDTDTARNINHNLDWTTSSIVLVGCLAVFAGLFLAELKIFKPIRLVADQRVGTPPVADLKVGRVTLLSFVSIALFAYYASHLGIGNLFTNRLNLDFIRNSVWADRTTASLITGATQMGLVVAVVAQMQIHRKLKAEGKPRSFFLFGATAICLLVAVNPISSPRYVFGTALMAVLTALGAVATLKRFRFLAAGAVFAMVYLFPIADMFRTSLSPSAKSQNPLQSMLSGDFDSFSQITNTVEYVGTQGIAAGQQLLGVIFFWVPRSIWPDKPIDTGSLIANFKLYNFANLSEPIWAEFFINGGWVLLLVGMMALGFLIRRLDKSTENTLTSKGVPGSLGCILPFYLILVLRGSLLQSMAYMSVILVAYLFIRQSPRQAARVVAGAKRGSKDRFTS